VRGVISAAGYVPYRRLQRSAISAFLGSGGGRGARSVASHDEDTTTMGVEAARLALAPVPAAAPSAVWFSTANPAYLDKTNATTLHAALRFSQDAGALDFGGALRSGTGALQTAMTAGGTTLVVLSDQRDGLPSGADESAGGDAACAFLVGEDGPGAPVIAELVGFACATDEFTDRWRTPGDKRSKVWEERFGETRYLPLGADAWSRALKSAGIEASQLAHVAVSSMHSRAAKALAAKLLGKENTPHDDLSATVGNAGSAHAGVLLASMLEQARPGELLALVSLADGADVLVLKTTDAIAVWTPRRTVAAQIEARADLPYGKFLSWRGMLSPEPPRRPEPLRVQSRPAGGA
jgi:hydroxymethylglutaryl-CoA synthase